MNGCAWWKVAVRAHLPKRASSATKKTYGRLQKRTFATATPRSFLPGVLLLRQRHAKRSKHCLKGLACQLGSSAPLDDAACHLQPYADHDVYCKLCITHAQAALDNRFRNIRLEVGPDKAQIVGAGYIMALNLVLRFGDLLPTHSPIGPLFYAVVWGIVIMPIFQFGQVLYPSRTRAEKDLAGKTSGGSNVPGVYYLDPYSFATVRDLVHQALKSDWTSVLAAELLNTSRVRTIKQARFRRGLMMTVVAFIALGGEQLFRSFAIG